MRQALPPRPSSRYAWAFSCFALLRGNLAADAFDVEATENTLARAGEFGTDGAEIGAQQPAVALGEAARHQHVAHPGARALHDDRGHGIVHRPHGERTERHHGDVGLLARREAADAI